ncbi:uncharacterized protein LOC107627368 [Arachis ipaensis]|uniref:uncharacterized protein LOC107627368 n=1 Tax=Arachis ipaensis TaxID=130454 RepID=UPI0007AF4762|nr:uncharacterized protein LOC107627368 [Arachis ipaensis]
MDPPSTSNTQSSISSALLSQPLPNPKGGINAITLKSDTTLHERSPEEPSSTQATQDEDVVEVEDVKDEDKVQEAVEEEVAQPRDGVSKEDNVLKEAISIPFPHLARRTKKQVELDPKMVDIFKKVEEKTHDLETIPLGSSISALMGAIPEKYGDPGPCIVTCTIGGVQFVDCTCDLGACVNIMPLSVYDALKLPLLRRSAAGFVLADKSIISVVGIAEDVLVSIKELIFPINLYILEMPPNDSGRPSSILLGRPFLKTSRFKLDAFSVHQEIVEKKNTVQGASVGKLPEYIEDTLPPPMVPDNQVPNHELTMELKPLPPHLKYAYLEDNQKLPVIIAKELTFQQEERLLNKDVEFDLSEDCMEAFEKLKIALTQAPIVKEPDWSRPFEIMCDASNHAVGAALAQCEGKDPYIIAYWWTKL